MAQTTGLKKFNDVITKESTQSYLQKVLKDKAPSFVNNLTALVANNKMLQDCEPTTIMYAAIKATSLNLPFDANLGFAYVIPYRNNGAGVTEAQFQVGYKAFIQLAQRSGQIRTINVRDVREGEIIGEDFVSGELQFKALPSGEREKAKVVGYVGFFELVTGFRKMSYWSVERIQEHAKKYSQTFRKGNGVWADNFDAMAKKTVLKEMLSKYAPLSVDMQNAIKADQAIFTGNEESKYVDNTESYDDLQAEVANNVDKNQGKQKVNASAMMAEEVPYEEVQAEKPKSKNDLF